MTDSATIEKTKEKIDEEEKKDQSTEDENEPEKPRKFKVILHNDDYTTMRFVVKLLKKVFKKEEGEANSLMLEVHNDGYGVAGVYSKQIAETKVEEATQLARSEGHPLRVTMEPAEE
jgi:ATP-dependent Clp protease adaptor protein ClpS